MNLGRCRCLARLLACHPIACHPIACHPIGCHPIGCHPISGAMPGSRQSDLHRNNQPDLNRSRQSDLHRSRQSDFVADSQICIILATMYPNDCLPLPTLGHRRCQRPRTRRAALPFPCPLKTAVAPASCRPSGHRPGGWWQQHSSSIGRAGGGEKRPPGRHRVLRQQRTGSDTTLSPPPASPSSPLSVFVPLARGCAAVAGTLLLEGDLPEERRFLRFCCRVPCQR